MNELANPDSCLSKAAPDEPIFVLRANDPLAAQTIRLWATMATCVHEEHKVKEASIAVEQMLRWREANMPEPKEIAK